MDLTNTITMDPEEARERADELEAHRRHLTPEEEAFLDGYRALASGRPVLNLRDTIAAGGCFEDRHALPRLAVARAVDRWVHVSRDYQGGVRFHTARDGGKDWSLAIERVLRPLNQAAGEYATYGSCRAMVPPVPLGTRMRLGAPRRGGWRPCLTLFEVGEWATAPRPPGDPALIRHIGGDLYVIEATWDLTDLERAVLAGARVA